MGEIYTNPPQSRNEAILRATIDNTEYSDPPQSRIEDLLLELKEAIEQGAGVAGVSSFNSRTGAVTPTAGDYEAEQVTYDNQTSGLTATEVQAAIDELLGEIWGLDTAKADKVSGAINGNFASLDSNGNLIDSGKKASEFADRTDITSIIATGSTNTTGAKITLGEYFYLNGVFCRATANIATSATFTKNTNYEEVTVGSQIRQEINLLDPNATYVSDSHVYSIDIGGFLVVQGYCSITVEVPINTILFTLSSVISKTFITGVNQYLSGVKTDGTTYMLSSTANSNTISVANNPIPAGTYSFFGILAVKS